MTLSVHRVTNTLSVPVLMMLCSSLNSPLLFSPHGFPRGQRGFPLPLPAAAPPVEPGDKPEASAASRLPPPASRDLQRISVTSPAEEVADEMKSFESKMKPETPLRLFIYSFFTQLGDAMT